MKEMKIEHGYYEALVRHIAGELEASLKENFIPKPFEKCECGELIKFGFNLYRNFLSIFECSCGRKWKLTVSVEQVPSTLT